MEIAAKPIQTWNAVLTEMRPRPDFSRASITWAVVLLMRYKVRPNHEKRQFKRPPFGGLFYACGLHRAELSKSIFWSMSQWMLLKISAYGAYLLWVVREVENAHSCFVKVFSSSVAALTVACDKDVEKISACAKEDEISLVLKAMHCKHDAAPN